MLGFLTRLFRGVTESDRAAVALRRGDTHHAAQHLGQALLSDPDDRKAHELVEALASSAPGYAPDQYASLSTVDGGPLHAGRIALRLALLARNGEYAEAFWLLVQLVVASPQSGREEWISRWSKDPRFAKVDALALLATLKAESEKHRPGGEVFPRLMKLGQATARAHPNCEALSFFLVVELRRMDACASANLAESNHRARPSYETAVPLYGSLLSAGDSEGALRVMREALAFAPHQLGPRLDMADLFLSTARLEEALTEYQHVLRAKPGHPWALPSSCYVRLRLGAQEALAELQHLASSGNERARWLLANGMSQPGGSTQATGH
jgi:Tfp pilus assembly protein PilF